MELVKWKRLGSEDECQNGSHISFYTNNDRYSFAKYAGLFMALQPRIIACGTKRAVMGMVIRFMCGPLVMSASSIVIGLRQDRLHTAIVQVLGLHIFLEWLDICSHMEIITRIHENNGCMLLGS